MSPDVAPASLVAVHEELNRSTLACWDRYAPHRERVMDLLPHDGTAASVGLLGAGNCNDIDLTEVARRFSEVHLVDIDHDACSAAIAGAGIQAQAHVADLSGVLARLERWKTEPPQPAEMRAAPGEASAAAQAAIPGPFDVVLSSAVVSQLVWSCMDHFGTDHPALRAVALTAMLCHVQIAWDLTAPGGAMFMTVDTVARTPDVFDELAQRMTTSEMLVMFETTGQCLPATESAVLTSAIAHVGAAAAPAMVTPWLWRVAEQRTSLVYGLIAQKG